MKKYLIFLSLLSLLSAGEIVSSGEVLVNGKALDKNTKIKHGDTIETKANSSIRFNVASEKLSQQKQIRSLNLRNQEQREFFNVVNGGVMAVFGKGNHGVATPNMTAGIRGTGTYTLVKDSKTYFCTCYGHIEVGAHGETKDLKATHHKMLWITKDKIKDAKTMENHNDDELRVLEKMVGRTVPFDQKRRC